MIGEPETAAGWIEALWRASWQGGLFIAAVWVLCLAPRLPVRWRCWLWWAASLRLLVGLIEIPALSVPVLPAAPAASVETAPRLSASDPAPKNVTAPLAPPAAPPSPTDLLLGLWITGALIRVGAGGRTLLRVYWLRRTARPVEATGVREEVTRLCNDAGVRRPPLMLVSPEARAPMLIGPLSPALLLPVEAIDAYNESELRIALAHELVHLRRGDLWLSAVPGLAQSLFFFHPLAWLAAREWAIAREAACDAETLQLTAARPADYGRFLLRLADSGAAPAGALNATPAYRTLERRLKMLRDTASGRPWSARSRPGKLAGVLLVAAIAGGFLPWQVTAKEAAEPAVPNSTAGAQDGGARAPAVKPDATPSKKDVEARADLERAAMGRFRELLQKRDQQLAARLRTLEQESARASRSQRERLLKQLEVQDHRDLAAALQEFEAELKGLVRRSVAKGADPQAAERIQTLIQRLVKDLVMRTAVSQRKNQRMLLESLERTNSPEFDPATGKLRVLKGAAAITGRIPVPPATGAPLAPPAGALSEVSIRGNTAIPLEALLKVVKTRAGEPFDRSQWEKDQVAISRLYQEQGYQVRLESDGPKDGKLELTLRELAVGEVKFKWRTPESERHLKAAKEPLLQKAGGLYNVKELQKDFRSLQTLGLFETINPVVEVGETGDVVLVWELAAKK